MSAYVEIMTDAQSDKYGMIRFPLFDIDLREIGEFTRENVAQWLANWLATR